MAKKKKSSEGLPQNLISGEILKEIQACRPARLFIKKQKKKGNEGNALAIRAAFLHLSSEKQMKYFQKSVDKYIQILDDKGISEHVQIEGRLFENLLNKKDQNTYFQLINAPTKPPNTAASYYSDVKKQENDENPKAWKLLTADEKKPFVQLCNNAKTDYSAQVKNFADDLPDRLKAEYLLFVNQTHHTSSANVDNEDNSSSGAIRQRRRSVQSIPESFKTSTSDNQQKLTRSQLDDLHKCQPSVIYYEKKVPDDEKPTFATTTAKNVYIRSVLNQLNEKKRHKFILKSTQKWQEFLEANPTVTDNQIPTLHLLLGRNEDVHYFFSSLGLPVRPPISAPILYNNEKQETGSQQNWADLSQTVKDEYIKRLNKLKHDYHQNFLEFVEKTLPNDYLRLEFFRSVKHAAKDYELVTRDRTTDVDPGQSKITQYLTPKNKIDGGEFDRIKQQLLSTPLSNEQKNLVHRLGQLMNKYIEETTTSKKNSTTPKTSPGAKKSPKMASSPHPSTDSHDVQIINGELSSEPAESSAVKKKKKRKRDQSEVNESSSVKLIDDSGKGNSSFAPTKKRK